MPSHEQLKVLRDHYLTLLRLEIDEFGVKPTEVRHLIGRLGEIHATLLVGGEMAREVNQRGFDVVCPRQRRISVKITAQSEGFVAIGHGTKDKADDLMVLRFHDGELETVYHGPMLEAVAASRNYLPDKQYEFDLSRARQLHAARSASAT